MKCGVMSTAYLLSFVFASAAQGQVNDIGLDGKKPSSSANAAYCATVEPLRPNLVLGGDTNVRGQVTDQTTAPLRNSSIELRRFISAAKQIVAKKSSTDANGKFDLRTVKKGQYRLLLSPHRGFKQPEKLDCKSHDCFLDVTLIANGSDQLAATCPLR